MSRGDLDHVPAQLNSRLNHFFQQKKAQLNLHEKTNSLLNPENILKKGYSITYCNGKVLKDAKDLKSGDQISTKLDQGTVESVVRK